MSRQKTAKGETPSAVPRAVRDRSAAESLKAVNRRLEEAEHQLEVQFTRIAQLQVQLDLTLAAFRRLTERLHKR